MDNPDLADSTMLGELRDQHDITSRQEAGRSPQ